MTTSIFICYRALDSNKVDQIVTRLRSLQDGSAKPLYDIWQDKLSIPAASDWWNAIVQGIINCDVFIFMLSRESVQNTNCLAELSYARVRNRPVVPVVLENEYTFDPVTGRNSIDFPDLVPDEIKDGRFQLLFYEGSSFYQQLPQAISEVMSRGWRDLPAPQPPDPRPVNEATNNVFVLYEQACDYAYLQDFAAAERLFRRIIDWGASEVSEDAYGWIQVLRSYNELLDLSASQHLQHVLQPKWQAYIRQFPKPFIDYFDPQDIQNRIQSSTIDRRKHYRQTVYPGAPAAMLFLIDQSANTGDNLANSSGSFAQNVATIINRRINDLIIRSSKGERVSRLFDIAVIGYGNRSLGPSGVGSALPARFANRHYVGTDELVDFPRRIEQHTKKTPDGMGGLMDLTIDFPIWVEAAADAQTTPMSEGFRKMLEVVRAWVAAHQESFPPIVMHVSRGVSSDGYPVDIAKMIRSQATMHGNALLFNYYSSDQVHDSIVFPSSPDALPDATAKTLFEMSSEFPEPWIEVATQIGMSIDQHSRGLGVNVEITEFDRFLELESY